MIPEVPLSQAIDLYATLLEDPAKAYLIATTIDGPELAGAFVAVCQQLRADMETIIGLRESNEKMSELITAGVEQGLMGDRKKTLTAWLARAEPIHESPMGYTYCIHCDGGGGDFDAERKWVYRHDADCPWLELRELRGVATPDHVRKVPREPAPPAKIGELLPELARRADVEAAVEALPPDHPATGPLEITGVHWRGTSRAYFDHFEAVNKDLAKGIAAFARQQLEKPAPPDRSGVIDTTESTVQTPETGPESTVETPEQGLNAGL